MDVTTGGQRTRLLVTVGAYCALFLFGLVQGMIGSFQYSRMAGAVPVAAFGFCALILATCVLAARGMRSVSGALAPALGWILASFVLSMPVSNGSVIVSDSTAGKCYLYGGTAAAVLGVLASLSISIWPAGRR